MDKMKKLYLLLAVLAIMSVSACGATKKMLGFTREGPDETNVKTNKPLVLPPEYNVRPQKKTEVSEDNTADNEE